MGFPGHHNIEKNLYDPKHQLLVQELVAWSTNSKSGGASRGDASRPKQAVTSSRYQDGLHTPQRSRPAEDIGDVERFAHTKTPQHPDLKNVYAWAARQFQQEARSASTATRRKSISENRKHTPGCQMETMKSAPVYSVGYFSHEGKVSAFVTRQLRKSFNTKVFGGEINHIIPICMPAHSSHLLQPLDIGCFALSKHSYGRMVEQKMRNGINHIDKLDFLEAILPVCTDQGFETGDYSNSFGVGAFKT
jgi:hypothetical protein